MTKCGNFVANYECSTLYIVERAREKFNVVDVGLGDRLVTRVDHGTWAHIIIQGEGMKRMLLLSYDILLKYDCMALLFSVLTHSNNLL